MIGPTGFRHRGKIGRFASVSKSEAMSFVGRHYVGGAEWRAVASPGRIDGDDETLSSVALVELVLTCLLSEAGWSPADSSRVVGETVASVFFNALLYADGALEITGEAQEVQLCQEEFRRSFAVANELTGGPHCHMCLWPLESGEGFRPATRRWSDAHPSPKTIDLLEVAREIVAKLGRPLLTVELPNRGTTSGEQAVWVSTARVA